MSENIDNIENPDEELANEEVVEEIMPDGVVDSSTLDDASGEPEGIAIPVAEGHIKEADFARVMSDNYMLYSYSVITDRALPDIKDGLLPVQRRIILAMRDKKLYNSGAYTKSAKIIGECFPKGTMVHTQEGLRAIEEINPGDFVLNPSGKNVKVTKSFHNPKQDLVDVALSNGNIITTTPGQLFQVVNNNYEVEWVKAKDLQGKQIISIENNIDINTNNISDEGYLMGLIVAEGFPHDRRNMDKHRTRVEISMTDKEPLEFCKKIIDQKEKGEYKERFIKAKKTNYKDQINLSIYDLDDTLTACRKKSKFKTVPKFIIENKNSYLSFIAGMIDGDGCVKKDPSTEIIIISTSKRLVKQIHLMLLDLGIHSSQGLYADHNLNNKWNSSYHVTIRGNNTVKLAKLLVENDLIKIPKKNNRLKAIIDKRKNSFKNESIHSYNSLPAGHAFKILNDKHLGAGWFIDIDGNKFRMGLKHASPKQTKIRYSADRFDSNFSVEFANNIGILEKLGKVDTKTHKSLSGLANKTFIKVNKVAPHPNRLETYDIQVDSKDHSFMVEGCVVHNCMGNYHPHGDMAIYGAMVRMAQTFTYSVPLVEGHGNFGSIDGDGAAAARYTEAKMSKATEFFIKDLHEEIIPEYFTRNFDESLPEPEVMPVRFPNLLVNGAIGIAVGMTTKMLPHNPSEVIDLCSWRLDHPDAPLKTLVKHLSGPDFPTGSMIINDESMRNTYINGDGKITALAKLHVEQESGNRNKIVITELPWMVQKGNLLQKIAACADDGKIAEIVDLNDYSSKKAGIIIDIGLKRGADPQKVIKKLQKFTSVRETYGVQMNVLVDGLPKKVNLAEIVDEFLGFRKDIVVNRAKKRIKEINRRLHQLEAYIKAQDAIDDVIKIIKTSADRATAKKNLEKRLKIDEQQSQWIIELPLGSISKLDVKKLKEEDGELRTELAHLEKLIKTESMIIEVIKEEFKEVKGVIGCERRSTLVDADAVGESDDGDDDSGSAMLGEKLDCSVFISTDGYVTAFEGENKKTQHLNLAPSDTIIYHNKGLNTHMELNLFSDTGKCYRLRVAEIPLEARKNKGVKLSTIVGIPSTERIVGVIPVTDPMEGEVLFVYKLGKAKRTANSEFANANRGGVVAAKPAGGDEVISAILTNETDELLMTVTSGKVARIKVSDVSVMGKASNGVKAVNPGKDGHNQDGIILSAIVVKGDEEAVLFRTDKDFQKMVALSEFPTKGRGSQGVALHTPSDKYGALASATLVKSVSEGVSIYTDGKEDELITKKIPVTKRATVVKPI